MFAEIKEEIRKTDDYKEQRKRLIEEKLFYQLPNQSFIAAEVLNDDKQATELLKEIKKHTEDYPSGKIVFEKQKKAPYDKRGYEQEGWNLIVHMYTPEKTDTSKQINPTGTKDLREPTFYVSSQSFTNLQEIALNYENEKYLIEQTKIAPDTI